MHRRDLLSGAAALGTGGLLAGCATESPAGTPTDEPAPTATDTPTATPTPAIAGTDFSVVRINSGTEVNEASVSFEGDRVAVTGTIAGADGCKTAYLDNAELVHGALVVTVATKDRPDAGMCTQAIVEIDYEASVSFEGPLPAEVRVVHESLGETVEVTVASRPEG